MGNQLINNIGVTLFAQRHADKTAPVSGTTLSLQEVANLLTVCATTEGYRPKNYAEGGRTLIARVPEELTSKFTSGVTLVRPGEEVIKGKRARVEGEEPRWFREVVRTEKPAAQVVDLIFYNSIALAITDDNTLPAKTGNWELVAISASEDHCMDAPPMSPEAVKANYHGLDGGTPTDQSEEEYEALLAKAEAYWGTRANVRVMVKKKKPALLAALLNPASREAVGKFADPLNKEVCHHITAQFKCSPEAVRRFCGLPWNGVVWQVITDGTGGATVALVKDLQVMVEGEWVDLPAELELLRLETGKGREGQELHVTVSHHPERQAKYSNEVIERYHNGEPLDVQTLCEEKFSLEISGTMGWGTSTSDGLVYLVDTDLLK